MRKDEVKDKRGRMSTQNVTTESHLFLLPPAQRKKAQEDEHDANVKGLVDVRVETSAQSVDAGLCAGRDPQARTVQEEHIVLTAPSENNNEKASRVNLRPSALVIGMLPNAPKNAPAWRTETTFCETESAWALVAPGPRNSSLKACCATTPPAIPVS